MSKHRFTTAGKINSAYRMGGLIVAFSATSQAVAVSRHRKMSDYIPRADLTELPPFLAHEGPVAEGPQHLYAALKRRYPECKICVVSEQPVSARRTGPSYYPGHELLRKVCSFLNNEALMPLAFAAVASPAERTRRTREDWVALYEAGKRYGLH